MYITCLSKFVQNYPHQLYSIDKQKSNHSFKSKFSRKKIKYKFMLISLPKHIVDCSKTHTHEIAFELNGNIV